MSNHVNACSLREQHPKWVQQEAHYTACLQHIRTGHVCNGGFSAPTAEQSSKQFISALVHLLSSPYGHAGEKDIADAHQPEMIQNLPAESDIACVMGSSDTSLICAYPRLYEMGAGRVQACCRFRAESSPIRSAPQQQWCSPAKLE